MVPAAMDGETRERTPRLSLALATRSCDIAAAQRLRHRVFVEEMGAQATVQSPGREHDLYDPWCEHLIVRDRTSGEAVGTYRLLTADSARRLGACLQTETLGKQDRACVVGLVAAEIGTSTPGRSVGPPVDHRPSYRSPRLGCHAYSRTRAVVCQPSLTNNCLVRKGAPS